MVKYLSVNILYFSSPTYFVKKKHINLQWHLINYIHFIVMSKFNNKTNSYKKVRKNGEEFNLEKHHYLFITVIFSMVL